MSVTNSKFYWAHDFTITENDINRIVRYIQRVRKAQYLTDLARRVIRGRLLYGEDLSDPIPFQRLKSLSVRLWDPTQTWKPGDLVIVAVTFPKKGKNYREPYVGEVINVTKTEVDVHIDELKMTLTFSTKPHYGSDDLSKWHQTVKNLVYDLWRDPDVEARTTAVFLEHGERIVSQLLNALKADERFVRLSGRWFLRELAKLPTQVQLNSIAWALAMYDEPQPTETLALLAEPPLVEGDAGLFGLYLAMRERPDIFHNVTPGLRPQWILAGPPPGEHVVTHAAYDPDTYEILCLPNSLIDPQTVQRLWKLGLLKAVV